MTTIKTFKTKTKSNRVKYNKNSVSLDFESYSALVTAADRLIGILNPSCDDAQKFDCLYTTEDMTCLSLDDVRTLLAVLNCDAYNSRFDFLNTLGHD